jgi:hypothetical protein
VEFYPGRILPQSQKSMDSLTVVPSEVLDRICIPEMALENYVFPEPTEAAVPLDRAPIPKPTEFAGSLKAYVDKLTRTCPLCGHSEGQKEEKEAETG